MTLNIKTVNHNIIYIIRVIELSGGNVISINCTPPAMDDFPHDMFTEEQRQSGALVFHISTSLYLFLALAIVCDKYFVPAVERICKGEYK